MGETLVDDGKITTDDVKEVLRTQKEWSAGPEAFFDEEVKPARKSSRKAAATKSPKKKVVKKAAKTKERVIS